MVLLSAGITTKSGKCLMSRQFVDMSRTRIEGLFAAFPKIMGGHEGKGSSSGGSGGGQVQHTFVETDSVRYVYQPLQALYVVLITTKTSNILEDLETLRLFARVLPEYCRSIDESEVMDNVFQLIFAFDEIVALGYRENVNLAQIQTFTKMDSHEEKVHNAVRQTQEREARAKAKEVARELQKQKMEAARAQRAGGGGGGTGSGIGGGSFTPSGGGFNATGGFSGPTMGNLTTPDEPPKPKFPTRNTSSKAMKLGGKGKNVDTFVDQLKSEGEKVSSQQEASQKPKSRAKSPDAPTESVHVSAEEKLRVIVNRDGGLKSMELTGMLTLKIGSEDASKVRLTLGKGGIREGTQPQTHPNIDKGLFGSQRVIGMKQAERPFPVNTDVGVLKWRFVTEDESMVPLMINCWPSENNSGGCDVNIEYELEDDSLELRDVEITIPVPSGSGAPVMNECTGEYEYDKRKGALVWRLPVVDANEKSGSMDFTAAGAIPDNFFPVTLNFHSKNSYCGINVESCVDLATNEPVKFSSDTNFFPVSYEVQ